MEARLAKQGRELALLRARLDRYEAALNGSNVTVFSQDDELRYLSISNPMLGMAADNIIGRTDAEILPEQGRSEVIALKQGVLFSGKAATREIAIGSDGAMRWFDLNVEPFRSESGEVVGLTCAAIDITRRKESDAHLRLLMRELTHRSKNLLAVIQAMARQTAKFADSTDGFLDQFNARLHALAASHDLLVAESWHGAALDELIRSQLSEPLRHPPSVVRLSGPPIVLKPEAAQSLGLALHELMENAEKHGALLAEEGRVDISWRRMPAAEGLGLELIWAESGGPPVKSPAQAGFGTMVIDHNLARSLEAQVSLAYETKGLCCRIVLPVNHLLVKRG
jgi:PAS domain S-box-containing protein